jgi:hypothetical protein
MELLSPLTTLADGRDAFYKISPWPFWISLAVVQLLAWLLLLFSTIRLRHSLREPEEVVTNRASKIRGAENPIWESSSSDGPRWPAKKRIRFLHAYSNPVDWLVQRQRGILTTLWIAAAIEILYFASSWAVFRGMFALGWPAVMN